MSPTIELLEEMRGRVPMYIGSNSVAKLASFLRGYQCALEKYGAGRDDDFLANFQEMTQSRYGVKVSKAWEDIILFQSCDDHEAMELFWQLFDDYCASLKNGDLRELTNSPRGAAPG
jgi:hypothetical protein